MTPAYINCVKRKLETLRSSGELGRGYVKPTRAFIRNECVRLYHVRVGVEDRKTLADFFKHEGPDATLGDTIYNVDTENLKALQNFLSGETQNPNYKVVEMCAWLIDFELRPYNSRVDYSKFKVEVPEPKPEPVSTTEKSATTTPIVEPWSGSNKLSEPGSRKPENPERKNRFIAAALLVLISGLVGFQLLTKKKNPPMQSSMKAECMYWAEDKYVYSACIQRGPDTMVIPLDPTRLQHFKRITDTTTINENSIGKVWYGIKNGNYEFYTAPGKHPVDGKNLRRFVKDSYEKFRKSQRQ